MTIIRPNKNKSISKFLILLLSIIFVGGGCYIFEYNNFVNIRHERNDLKKSIADMQNANADLKNQLYEAVDPGILRTLASNQNLVLDEKPQYLRD